MTFSQGHSKHKFVLPLLAMFAPEILKLAALPSACLLVAFPLVQRAARPACFAAAFFSATCVCADMPVFAHLLLSPSKLSVSSLLASEPLEGSRRVATTLNVLLASAGALCATSSTIFVCGIALFATGRTCAPLAHSTTASSSSRSCSSHSPSASHLAC